MLKIIICDDDHFTQNWIYELVSESINYVNIKAEVVCRSISARELLKYIERNSGEYLFLLDLELGSNELNGLDLAKVLRSKCPDSKIVFVTSHTDKSMEILKSGVEPFGFIEKNINHTYMVKELSNILIKLRKRTESEAIPEKIIELPIGIDEYVQIPISRISYVETLKNRPHHICYHTLDGSQITVRDTISHALELLGNMFVASHRSIIVNTGYVIGITKNELKLANGKTVPCTMGRRKYFDTKRQE